MTWSRPSRGCGVEARLGPTCRVAVSTTLAMTVMVAVDMLAETTVHIAGWTAVEVGPGCTWAAGVSFRKMNRSATPRWSRW